MPAAEAARLIRTHHVRLSRAIARQIRQVVPRYQAIEESVLERNIQTILSAVRPLLENGNDAEIISVIRNVIDMRAVGGFTPSDFVVACLCVLPVMRRFLMERSADPVQALASYEAFELVAIPFMGRFVSLFEKALGSADQQLALARYLDETGWGDAITIEQVLGDEREERR